MIPKQLSRKFDKECYKPIGESTPTKKRMHHQHESADFDDDEDQGSNSIDKAFVVTRMITDEY
jgi:hypothetical protein